MTKTLYLLRHAKSSWDEPGLTDFDRPLNKRGQKTAPLMGKMMREHGIEPGLILCSPAKRTRQTAELVMEKGRLKAPVLYVDDIYESSARRLLSVLATNGRQAEVLLLVGHNPGLADLLQVISGAHEHFPTAALACLSVEVDEWKDIQSGAGRLEWLWRPRELFQE